MAQKVELTEPEVSISGKKELTPPPFGSQIEALENLGTKLRRTLAQPEVQRALVEAGVSVAAIAASGPLAPATAAGTVARSAVGLGIRAIAGGAGMTAGSLLAETFDPSERPFQEAGDAFFFGAFGEVAGSGLAALGKKIIAPAVKRLEPGAAEAVATVKKAGGMLLPGQASESRTIDLLQNIAEASLLGGGRISKVQSRSENAVIDMIDGFVDTFRSALSKESVGDLTRIAISDASEIHRAFIRTIARSVDDLAEGVKVDIRAVKEASAELAARAEQGIDSESLGRVLKAITDKPDFVPFETADILRSDMLAIGRGTTELLPGRAQGAGQRLAGDLDEAIAKGGKSLQREEAIAQWRLRNQLVKEGKGLFNARAIRSLAAKDPEQVFQAIIKPGSPTSIRRARKIILGELDFPSGKVGGKTVEAGFKRDEELWQAVQGQYLDDLLRTSVSEKPGAALDAVKALTKMKTFGDDALKELFPNGADKQIKEYLRALSFVQKETTKEKTGRMLIQLTQGAAILNVPLALMGATSAPLSASMAIILGPQLLSFLFTRPTIAKLLTVGLKAPPGSRLASRAATQMLAAMDKEGLLPQQIALFSQARNLAKGALSTVGAQ